MDDQGGVDEQGTPRDLGAPSDMQVVQDEGPESDGGLVFTGSISPVRVLGPEVLMYNTTQPTRYDNGSFDFIVDGEETFFLGIDTLGEHTVEFINFSDQTIATDTTTYTEGVYGMFLLGDRNVERVVVLVDALPPTDPPFGQRWVRLLNATRGVTVDAVHVTTGGDIASGTTVASDLDFTDVSEFVLVPAGDVVLVLNGAEVNRIAVVGRSSNDATIFPHTFVAVPPCTSAGTCSSPRLERRDLGCPGTDEFGDPYVCSEARFMLARQ